MKEQTQEINSGAWFVASLFVTPIAFLILIAITGNLYAAGFAGLMCFLHMNGFKW